MSPNSIINNNPLKLAVVGSRSCSDDMLIIEYLTYISVLWEDPKQEDSFRMELVSGGAKGPDTIAERWAKVCRIPTKIFLPDWDKYGKAAGFIRNQQIVDYCNMVLAFWDRKSKGTKDSIDKALKAGKPVWIVPVS